MAALGVIAKSSVGELALVWIWESLKADQLSYDPGPDPGFYVGPPKIYIICEKVCPADPKLQDFYDMGQQEDNQEDYR